MTANLGTLPAVLTDVVDPADTLTTEPGTFGACLGILGFSEGRRSSTYADGLAWTFDRPECRVICHVEDGDAVTVVAWSPEHPGAELETYRMTFSGGTPIAAVVAALGAMISDVERVTAELIRDALAAAATLPNTRVSRLMGGRTIADATAADLRAVIAAAKA